MLARVFGVHLVDGVPRDAGNRLSCGQCLRQLDLERVDARHVVNDHADWPAVLGQSSFPFRRTQRLGKGGQRIGSLLNSVGEHLCTRVNSNLLSKRAGQIVSEDRWGWIEGISA